MRRHPTTCTSVSFSGSSFEPLITSTTTPLTGHCSNRRLQPLPVPAAPCLECPLHCPLLVGCRKLIVADPNACEIVHHSFLIAYSCMVLFPFVLLPSPTMLSLPRTLPLPSSFTHTHPHPHTLGQPPRDRGEDDHQEVDRRKISSKKR